MTPTDLLRRVAAAGVSLSVEGDKLLWHCTRPPPPDLLRLMREQREELIGILRSSTGAGFLQKFMQDAYHALVEREPDTQEQAERAAIYGRAEQK